ncbi:hypothetical protein K502DRAFT_292906, partial [Neoconidiobolus thromboides FSU 785]
MSESISINHFRIRPACDQCFFKRVKCDLSIPTCSSCIERGKACTRLRKSKR